MFYKEIDNIYRLKVPFEDLYTSVFLIMTDQGNILIDCATYSSDVDEYIIPALRAMELSITDIKYLILTHNHGDHAGGKNRILELAASNINIIREIQTLPFDGVVLYEMYGHTLDGIGVFDERSGTLIAGDGLQGYGVGKYRCFLESKTEYIKTINKIEKDERINNIIFSHAYEPWNKDGAFGREKVINCLRDCKNALEKEKK